LWADSLTITAPGLPVITKSDAVAMFTTSRIRFDRYETSEIAVRVFGASAIVTGRLRRTRTIDSKTIDDDWRFTKSYVRVQGKWVVAAFHASPA
jgi:hypothetical protein